MVLQALLPRQKRRNAQLVLVVVALAVALVLVFALAGTNITTARGALAIDSPGLFLQGATLLIAVLAAFVMFEREADPAGDAFAPRASALPEAPRSGSSPPRATCRPRSRPLFLFSVGGMLVFVVSNDLLTMSSRWRSCRSRSTS